MTDDKCEYFVYIHTRPDKREVFYVGRGKRYSRCSPTYRAYDKRRRSRQWMSIVERNKGIYNVEIVCWCRSLKEVIDKEREYIKKYGKQIDGTGSLINLTDGGDGAIGLKHTAHAKEKMRKAWYANPSRAEFLNSEEFKKARKIKIAGMPSPMLGKKHSQETLERFSQQRSGSRNRNAKKVIDHNTGVIYGCVAEAANAINIGRYTLYKALSGERKNNTSLEYV